MLPGALHIGPQPPLAQVRAQREQLLGQRVAGRRTLLAAAQADPAAVLQHASGTCLEREASGGGRLRIQSRQMLALASSLGSLLEAQP